MSIKGYEQRPNKEDFESSGIVDGKHHLFRCSNCNAPLADLWVNFPSEEILWDFVAECCHCGDKSYKQTVHGSFFLGESEEVAEYTKVSDTDLDQDPIVIKTVQVKPYVL